MNWLKLHWFKIGILLCVILAIVYVYRFANKYLDQQNAMASQEAAQQQAEKDRAYAASQKEACLAIYKQESSKWSNVDGWRYDDKNDQCYVQYKQNPPKTHTECDIEYKGSDGIVPTPFIGDWLLCYEGLFEKAF